MRARAVPDITRRFLHSTGAAVFSQAWRVLVTLGVMVACRRLVPLDEYGLWNWVLPAFLILSAARDLGLVYHVIRIEPRPYGNLLALELVWGGTLSLLTVLFAPWLVSQALDSPIPVTVPIVQAMALFLFLEGLSSVPRVYFEGDLAVGKTVAPELLRNLLMAIVTVGLALRGWGVWSMALGQIAGAGLYAALLWKRAWGHIPLVYQRGQMLPLVRASLPLASIWLVAVLIRQIDMLILGKRFGTIDDVGRYGLAAKNALRVSEIIVPALTRSLYPALVAFAGQTRRLFETFSLSTVVLMAIEVPVALFLFLNAEAVVVLIGGEGYRVGTPMFLQVLCFGPLLDPLTRLGGEVLKTRHKDREWIAGLVVTLVAVGVAGFVLTGHLGPMGMAFAKLLPVGGLVMAWSLYRIAPEDFGTLIRRLGFVYLVPMPLFALAAWLSGPHVAWRFVLSGVALVLSMAISVGRFGPDLLRFVREAKGVTS